LEACDTTDLGRKQALRNRLKYKTHLYLPPHVSRRTKGRRSAGVLQFENASQFSVRSEMIFQSSPSLTRSSRLMV
jgi:hypothetical protein